MELQTLTVGEYWRTSDADPITLYRLPLVGRLFARRVTSCISLLPRGHRVLEIGYGSGISFLNLADKFEEVHGVDLHEHPQEVARPFLRMGLTLHLKQGTIERLPYDDDYFDAALAISIHEEIRPDQQARAFAEVRRVVRPGGCYVVGVPGVNAMMTLAFYALGCNIRKWHVTTEGQVLDHLRSNFEVDTTHYSPALFPKSMTTYVSMRGWKRPTPDAPTRTT